MRKRWSAVSGIVTRWEKERAAWLMGRSRPGSSARRRAELLGRRARRLSRGGSGVAQTSLHEDVTPSLFRRSLSTNDGAGEQLLRMIGVPILFGLALLVVGPAIAIGAGLYHLRWREAPKVGRLQDWPWIVAGALSLVMGIAAQVYIDVGPGAWLVLWPLALHVYLPILLPTWVWAQLTLGLFVAGWYVHSNGWAAVPKSAAPKAEKDKNGEFIKTAEKDKIRLGSLDGEGKVESEATAEHAAPRPKREPAKRLAKLSLMTEPAEVEDTTSTSYGDEPVFADEDAGLDEEIEFVEDSTAR